MSRPTGGLVLNPSEQIQQRDSPEGGRRAAISTKGIIKLSVYNIKYILYDKQMYGINSTEASVTIT